jgi:glycosyltransferase involved in cell wall biosynthesis
LPHAAIVARTRPAAMPEPAPVTVVIPCKNEETNLPECLRALEGFAADVVVVDSSSTDRTPAIARKHGATVLDFQWNGQFPKKRNWTLRHHPFQTEWVLFLDADEFVTEAFREEVRRTLPVTTCNGFWLLYDNYFMGELQRHGVPMRKLALFRVGKGEYEFLPEDSWSHLDMEVHEHAIIDGEVGEINSRIVHNDYRGLEHFIAKHNAYSSWEARRYLHLREHREEKWDQLTFRQRLKYRLVAQIWFGGLYFLINYVLRLGFLDGMSGLRFSLFKAYYFFQMHAKIREFDPNVSDNDRSGA